ncbi:MAG: hypothetical protein OXG81_04960 [Acidobacteria bacterium]|nr:hypothetical protein [Acidobacteriota bacterium]
MVGEGGGATHRTGAFADFFINDETLGHSPEMLPLKPGQTRIFRVPRPAAANEDPTRFDRGSYVVFTISVGLVVLDDGTFLGTNTHDRVQRLFESRLIQIEERVRFRRRLQRFVSGSDSSFLDELSKTLRTRDPAPPTIGSDYRRSNTRRRLTRDFLREIIRLRPDADALAALPPETIDAAARTMLGRLERSFQLASARLPAELRAGLIH